MTERITRLIPPIDEPFLFSLFDTMNKEITTWKNVVNLLRDRIHDRVRVSLAYPLQGEVSSTKYQSDVRI